LVSASEGGFRDIQWSIKVEYGFAFDLNGSFTPSVSDTWAALKLDATSATSVPTRLYRMSVDVLTKKNNGGVEHSMTFSDLAENDRKPDSRLGIIEAYSMNASIIKACIIHHVLTTSYKNGVYV
jgi:hypothetical protein